jgi:hypothetical protein
VFSKVTHGTAAGQRCQSGNQLHAASPPGPCVGLAMAKEVKPACRPEGFDTAAASQAARQLAQRLACPPAPPCCLELTFAPSIHCCCCRSAVEGQAKQARQGMARQSWSLQSSLLSLPLRPPTPPASEAMLPSVSTSCCAGRILGAAPNAAAVPVMRRCLSAHNSLRGCFDRRGRC